MRAFLTVLALLAVLAIPSGPQTAPAVLASTSAAGNLPTLLFRWKRPKQGHQHGWVISKGTAGYDGSLDSALLAPFKLSKRPNFVVQAQLRGLGRSSVTFGRVGFGLVVRTVAANPHTSVEGGSFFSTLRGDGSPNVIEDNNPNLYWNGQTAGEAAFDPGTAWHMYRLEVRGDQYALWIDGKPMVRYTITDYPGPVVAGVFSTFYRVQMRGLEIYTLDPGGTPVPTNPLLRQANLTVGDLPVDWFAIPDLQHWYTNAEIGREGTPPMPVSAIDATGRLSDYGVDFYVVSQDTFSVYSTVSEFTSPATARAYITARIQHFLDTYADPNSGQSNLQHFGDLGIGEFSDAVSVDFADAGVRAVLALVARGRYVILLRLGTPIALSPDVQRGRALAVHLTGIIDQRLRQAGT